MTIVQQIDGIFLEWNPSLHRLGSLCKRGHEWQETGQSVRLIKGSICAVCCRKHGRKEYAPIKPETVTELCDVVFDETVHYLGDICSKGHGYKNTGKSVRLKSGDHKCTYCNRLKDQERYKRKQHRQGKIVSDCLCEICENKRMRLQYVLSSNSFDSVECFLGSLCKRGHDYMETGFSLRKINRKEGTTRGNFCVECNQEWQATWEPKDREKYNFQKQAASHKRRARKQSNVHVRYTKEEKLARYALFNNGCAYCGRTEVKLTVEHVIAIKNNGHDALYNIIPACGRCNRSKGDRDLYTWYSKKSYFSQQRLELIESLVDFIIQLQVTR